MTITGYGVYLLLGWTSVLIPALIISIEDGFGRGDADIGAVYFVGALLNGAGALGGGFMAELLGHHHLLVISLGALTVGLFVQGTADRWLLFIGAVAIGQIGSGAANGGVQAVFMEIFPERRGERAQPASLVLWRRSVTRPSDGGLRHDRRNKLAGTVPGKRIRGAYPCCGCTLFAQSSIFDAIG